MTAQKQEHTKGSEKKGRIRKALEQKTGDGETTRTNTIIQFEKGREVVGKEGERERQARERDAERGGRPRGLSSGRKVLKKRWSRRGECKVTNQTAAVPFRLPAESQQAAVDEMACMYRGVELHSVHAPGIPMLADRIHERCREETGEVGNPMDPETSDDSRRQGG